jgi:hypothetical protein
MAKDPSGIELETNAWGRFERAVDTVVKNGPQHRSETQLILLEIPEGVEIDFNALSGASSLVTRSNFVGGMLRSWSGASRMDIAASDDPDGRARPRSPRSTVARSVDFRSLAPLVA